jgi:hypothetical protein
MKKTAVTRGRHLRTLLSEAMSAEPSPEASVPPAAENQADHRLRSGTTKNSGGSP